MCAPGSRISNPLDAILNLLYPAGRRISYRNGPLLSGARQRRGTPHFSNCTWRTDQFRSPAGPQDTGVTKLLQDAVVEFYKSRLDAQGISVEARYCPGEDLPIDPGSLRQVFSNLLLNAAYAMPYGGIIHARVAKAHEWSALNRHGLRVTFADNGCGISADDLPKVTEAFFTTKGSAGTGLGLALVKDMVEKCHGVLRVRSSTKPGCSGTVFAIFLPAD